MLADTRPDILVTMTPRSTFLAVCGFALLSSFSASQAFAQSYLGFDRNDYPRDVNLGTLRQTFSYIGYWLNSPPGATSNSWSGKRPLLESTGFGFLVLFNGRLDAQLRHNAAALGRSDGRSAVDAAKREGFPARTIIFLDLEEGGRMSPQQKSYIYAWVDAVNAFGFRAGVYCSGIPVREVRNTTIITADDIRANAHGREITYWVTNDVCPPSPGCVFPRHPPSPAKGRVSFADIWQFVQSPKRPEFAAKCGGYNIRDGNCYPPGIDPATHLHVDLNTASSPDPSAGR
jgi:Rv2525c-like, glycoside hydrolase-like domain